MSVCVCFCECVVCERLSLSVSEVDLNNEYLMFFCYKCARVSAMCVRVCPYSNGEWAMGRVTNANKPIEHRLQLFTIEFHAAHRCQLALPLSM